jgi:hypothetical protein
LRKVGIAVAQVAAAAERAALGRSGRRRLPLRDAGVGIDTGGAVIADIAKLPPAIAVPRLMRVAGLAGDSAALVAADDGGGIRRASGGRPTPLPRIHRW